MITTMRLGDMLVEAGKLTQQQLDDCLAQVARDGGRLSASLIERGHLSEETLVDFLSERFGVRVVQLDGMEIADDLIELVPGELARRYTVLPISKIGATLTVAMADPSNVLALDDIKFRTGYTVVPTVASESALREAIDEHYGPTQSLQLRKVMADLGEEDAASEADLELLDEKEEQQSEQEADLAAMAQESSQAPVVRLVNIILSDAIRRGASDIHLEPYEKEYRVRFRVDGVLYEVMSPPLARREAITSRLKIMAHLDIAEKRLPQDGRIKMKTRIGGRVKDLDFRVSVMPTIYGEKIVLRLLDKDQLMLDMARLGFEPESLRRFEAAILKPYGMVLVTGPTGSGKTNTLYSALSRLNQPGVNIMTAEDPVEFNLRGMNQVQMKDQIGLDFATALRSFLRQDPNIILVGEIRDIETAEVAIKAAMTGHLVLSTLHTNDAPSSVTRLMNMGIEPFLVATSVHLVAAQRLVRRICTSCREPADVPLGALLDIGFSEEEAASLSLFHGKGCERCSKTGYKGRIALFEAMPIDTDMRKLILSGASATELREKAVADGMITLRQSGLQKVRDGITSVEEIVRETMV